MPGGFPPGFENIFAQFNGFPFGFQQPPRNKTLNIQTTITLEEAFHGKELIANLQLPSGREQTIEVRIPAGIQDGTVLRLAGLGDDSYSHQPRGDIHLTVHVSQHPVWTRQGDDLLKSIQIDAIDAIIGRTVEVTTIDNRTLEMNIKPGTQPGQVYSAPGYGMPSMKDSRFVGRMLLTIDVTIPSVTEEQKIKLQQIFLK